MIPIKFQNAKYEDVPQPIKDLMSKLNTTRGGIYIHGSVGTGKTHIAYAIKKQYDRPSKLDGDKYTPERVCKFWNMTMLLHDMRQDFDRLPRDKEEPAEDLMTTQKLVILDDVGAEKMSDWVSETFYLIVNERYVNMYPTIFTSNLPIADLAERIGDRTVSRIVEMCDVVELIGNDRRITSKPKIKVNI